jgi:RNA polymerase sigma-70 factor (ECF subfamily)
MAFEVIYTRHKDKIFTYLNKRINDKNLIEDIFQCILVKFHKSRHRYSSEHHLLKWIYTICRSELLDSIKKNKAQLIELQDEHLISYPKEEDNELNLDQISTLSENEREALKLRYYSEEDFSKISKILNTSETNSRKLVSRGIKKLKAKLIGDKK